MGLTPEQRQEVEDYIRQLEDTLYTLREWLKQAANTDKAGTKKDIDDHEKELKANQDAIAEDDAEKAGS